jgi:hypothetical protein
MIRWRSASEKLIQPPISWRVRPHPAQNPEEGSMEQT